MGVMAMSEASVEDAGMLERPGDEAGKVSEREALLHTLVPLTDDVTAAAVGQCALTSRNRNLRKTAITALGTATGAAASEALSALEQVLDDPQPQHRFLRREAARALGGLATDDALAVLVRAAGTVTDGQVLSSIGAAIASFGERADIPALLRAAEQTDDERVRAELLTTVHRLGAAGAEEHLVRVALGDRFSSVRAAAVRGLGVLGPERALPILEQVGRTDTSARVRRRVVDALAQLAARGEGHHRRILDLLAELLLDPDPALRHHVVATMPSIGSPTERLGAILDQATRQARDRGTVDATELVAALLGDGPADADRTALCDALLQVVPDADDTRTGLVAALLVAAHRGDVDAAGAHVNDAAGRLRVPKETLERLRIAIGGETALDPVFADLRKDLEQHFHAPIDALNEETRTAWLATMEAAKKGFDTRIFMSKVVFWVGVGLLVASSLAFFLGNMSTGALFGAGASFASGLGVMLLVVYTGPLKDIRQSVSDLGASSAAYIAFVHRVLQVSHAFGESYLGRDLSPEKVEKLSKLIDSALTATVRSLQYEAGGEEER
jgi:HEAT repeat protein